MKKLIQMSVGKEDTVLIEVSEQERGGMGVAGVGTGGVIKTAEHAFDNVLQTVESTAKAVAQSGRNLDPRPDEIAVEYGVSVKADGKAFIASVGAEASFKIALTWKPADKK